MPKHHIPQPDLSLAFPALPSSTDDILSTSSNIDPAALDFEFISESYCQDMHPARLGVAQALRELNGTAAIRIAEGHLETLLRIAPDDKLEMALSHSLVAETYTELGDTNSALDHWKSAVLALRMCPPERKALKADLLCSLACCQVVEGEVPEGRASFRHARRIYRSLREVDDGVARVVVEKLLDFGDALRGGLQIDRAKNIFQQAFREAQKLSARANPLSQQARIGLGRCYLDAEQPEQAQEVFRAVVNNVVTTELAGSELHFYAHAGLAEAGLSMHPNEWNGAMNSLNYALSCIDRSRKEQYSTAAHLALLAGKACYDLGEPSDIQAAAGYLNKCLGFAGRSPENPRLLMIEAIKILVPCLHELGEFKKEGQVLAQQLGLASAHFGPDHEETISVHHSRLRYFEEMRRWPEAIEVTEILADHARRKFGGVSTQHVNALRDCAWTCSRAGQTEEALGRLWTARRIVRALPEAERRLLIGLYCDAAMILEHASRDRASLKRAQRALQIAQECYGENHPTVAEAQLGVARALTGAGRPRSASAHLREALAFYSAQNPPQPIDVARAYHMRGLIHHALRDFEAALRDFGKAERSYRTGKADSEVLFILKRDRAITVADKAEFFGVRQEREEALRFLANTIAEAEHSGQGDSEEVLDLLQLATRFAKDLDLGHEAAIHGNSYRRISAKLKAPVI